MAGYEELEDLEDHGELADAPSSSSSSSSLSSIRPWHALAVVSVCGVLLIAGGLNPLTSPRAASSKIRSRVSELASRPNQQYAGLPLLHCHDSVAWGSFYATTQAEADRFHGNVGQTYTVACPRHCSLTDGHIYGCGSGPYLDESSICRSALGAGLAGNEEISIVTFTLVEPVEKYPACVMKGYDAVGDSKSAFKIDSMPWVWQEWSRAAKSPYVDRYCGQGWATQNPKEPCEASIKKYRSNCEVTSGLEHCYGPRAFKFLKGADPPEVLPAAGQYTRTVQVTASAPSSMPDAHVACSSDGTPPNTFKDEHGQFQSEVTLTLGIGTWNVVCQSESTLDGPSRPVTRTFQVIEQTQSPVILPDSSGPYVGSVQVTMRLSSPLGTIYFTTDGSEPNQHAAQYNGPITISKVGNTK
eukprot:767011-Hanusia_phi.AAC.1